MRGIIMVVILAMAAVMILLAAALAGIAAPKNEIERMLEDEDQRDYLEEWKKRRRGFDKLPDE